MHPLQTAPLELLEGALLLGGLLFAFAGYPLYKLGLWLAGFVGGLQIGLVVGPLAEFALLGSVSEVSLLLAGIVGLLGGWLAILLEWVVVLVAGFAVGDLLSALLFGLDAFDPIPVLSGVAVGILALKLYVWAIILMTAFVGSWLLTVATALGTSFESPGQPLTTFLVVFLAGVVVQSGLYRLGISPLGSGSSADESPARSGPPRRHRCPECGHLNGQNRGSCFACGSPL